MDLFAVVATAFWVMLPAYIPNNAAVLAGGGRPIDGGRRLGEARLLGDGKTWRGTAVGWLAGVALALVLNAVVDPVSDVIGVTLVTFPVAIVVLFPLGAMVGDIGASFLKRRTGRQRGAPFPGVDQLDFVIGALLLGAIGDLLFVSEAWISETFTVEVLVVVLVMTPILHVLTNAIGYLLGLKDEPY